MNKFILEIELGNAEMETARDVAYALRDVMQSVGTGSTTDAGIIRDISGNCVGRWRFEDA